MELGTKREDVVKAYEMVNKLRQDSLRLLAGWPERPPRELYDAGANLAKAGKNLEAVLMAMD